MHHNWVPFDVFMVGAFAALIVGLPALGYVFMVLDYRAYLRSLRRTLIRAKDYIYVTPDWARAETPRAIAALGLRMPCTEADLKRAYRKKVKKLHPDHGGDQRTFLLLQAHFEEALAILSGDPPNGHPR